LIFGIYILLLIDFFSDDTHTRLYMLAFWGCGPGQPQCFALWLGWRIGLRRRDDNALNAIILCLLVGFDFWVVVLE
jgi:hypothetical protein